VAGDALSGSLCSRVCSKARSTLAWDDRDDADQGDKLIETVERSRVVTRPTVTLTVAALRRGQGVAHVFSFQVPTLRVGVVSLGSVKMWIISGILRMDSICTTYLLLLPTLSFLILA
jgi:hypothetical protein